MAPETKTSKRKATVPADEVAKVKKVKALAADILPKKRKAPTDASPAGATKISKAPKASSTDSPKSALKKSKSVESILKKPKSSKDVAKAEKKLKEIIEDETVDDDDEEVPTTADDPDAVEIIDDQTAALLAKFDSDSEDSDSELLEGGPDHELSKQAIPELDKKTRKKMRKLQEAAATQAHSDSPGVIYLGRIPHGFYENEMKQYFKQFGDIKNIRLSRNPRTGASKHYAFIEFESMDVAEIVAKTMDNYLMFGHILKCKLVPKESVHDNLFEGANRRFKKVPWNKIQGRKLAAPAGESAWEKRNEREAERRVKKQEKLKSQGIDYEFSAPTLKTAKAADRTMAIEATPAAGDQTIEQAQVEAPAEEEPSTLVTITKTTIETKVKPSSKGKKASQVVAEVEEMLAKEEAEPANKKEEKSSKKRVSDVTQALADETEKKPKKKAKKSKA